jgi:hypothetical protein
LIVGADPRPERARISTGSPAPHASSTSRPRAGKQPLTRAADPRHAVRLLPPADAYTDPAITPLAYVTARTRDLRIGMVAHVVLNSVDLVVLVLVITP